MRGEQWDDATRTLSAVSSVIAGEPYRVIVAANGYKPNQSATKGLALERLDVAGGDLYELTLQGGETRDVPWEIRFE